MKTIFTQCKKYIRVITAGMLLCFFFAAPAMAAEAPKPADCTVGGKPGVHTSFSFFGQDCTPVGTDLQSNIIVQLLKIVLAFLAGGVGVAAVGGIVFGGFLFMTARGDANQVKKGETVIRDVVIGILAFLGMAAVLNFFIPGGVLG